MTVVINSIVRILMQLKVYIGIPRKDPSLRTSKRTEEYDSNDDFQI